MGNTLIPFQLRIIIFLALVASSTFSVIVGVPYAKKILPTSGYSIQYYHYRPTQTVLASAVEPENLPSANSVPILMYHGVVDHVDTVNTTIANFTSDMETLKKNGYSTISVSEFDLFRQGKFTLPPKPIIITFDDGRKDSYYTTDDILRQLGFKATIFVATGPTIDGNPFYLTWDDLKAMKASGRWEIEAHGRYSHHKIPIDSTLADTGHYLTSRMYLVSQGRLETVAEFEQRVENDYLNGINDLKTHVGITPQYFAIPLNDYGQPAVSNYPDSFKFNDYLVKKYFKLAFVQVNDNINPTNVLMSFYNFSYSDPHAIRRLEVENLTSTQLLSILNNESPAPPQLSLSGDDFNSANFDKRQFTGKILYSPAGISLTANQPTVNGQIVFGQDYWRDYTASATIERTAGRSVVLLFNFQGQKNYLAFGRTDNGYFLRQTVNDVTTDLVPPYRPTQKLTADEPDTFTAITKDGFVTCLINGKVIFSQVPVTVKSGAVGFKVWGDASPGSGILQTLSVKQI